MGLNIRRAALASLLGGSAWLSVGLAAPHAPGDSTGTPAASSSTTQVALVPEPTESPRYLRDEHQASQGSISIGGHPLAYQAEAGVLVIHLKDPMDDDPPPKEDHTPPQPPEASM